MKYQFKIKDNIVSLYLNKELILNINITEYLTNDNLFNSVYPTLDYLDEDFLEDFCCDVPCLFLNKLSNEQINNLDYNFKDSEDLTDDFISTFNEAVQNFLGLDCDWKPLLIDEEEQEKIKFTYLILNKPKGYVTSTKDPDNRTVMELIHEPNKDDLFPVGRLDLDSTGLLLITNDGKLSNKLLSPSHHVNKTYEITSLKELSSGDIHTLEQGILMDDSFTKPCKIKKINNNTYHIIISEGRFHQVKRMLEYVNNKVLTLNRIKFGSISLGDLKLGNYRLLTTDEINKLKEIK